MDSSTDAALIQLYGDFGVPADRLAVDLILGERFVDELVRRTACSRPGREVVIWRLLLLRKAARLPRLLRHYRGRSCR